MKISQIEHQQNSPEYDGIVITDKAIAELLGLKPIQRMWVDNSNRLCIVTSSTMTEGNYPRFGMVITQRDIKQSLEVNSKPIETESHANEDQIEA